MGDVFSANDKLQGWDVAYSTTFDKMNAAIADSGVSPQTMTQSDKTLGTLDGSFGTWQLLDNDDAVGKVVPIHVPLHVKSCKLGPHRKVFSDLDYVFQVNVTLEFVEHATMQDGSKVHHLKVADPAKAAAGTTTVDVRHDSADVVQTCISMLLEKWLVAHITDFAHVFAVTTTDMQDDNSVFAGLLPQEISYAVASGPDVTPVTHDGTTVTVPPKTPAVFTVLCLLDKLPPGALPPNLLQSTDTSFVPEGCTMGFAMSSRVFLRHLLLPRLSDAMQLAQGAGFEVTRGYHSVLRNTTPLVLPDFDLSDLDAMSDGAKGPSPTLKAGGFEVRVEGAEMAVVFDDLSFEDDTGLNRFVLNYRPRFSATLSPEGHLSVSDANEAKATASVILTKAGQDYQIWVGFAVGMAVQVAVLALALIPGAQPAAAAVEDAAEGAGEVATEEIVANIRMIDDNEVAVSEASAESEMQAGSKAAQFLKNWGLKMGKKIGINLACTLVPMAVGDLPTIMAMIRKGHAQKLATPTLHDLTTVLMSANLWNGADMGKVRCKSAQFDDGMTLGLVAQKEARR